MSSDPSSPEGMTTVRPKERDETRTRQLPPYNVILNNDDHHSFEFVVAVLRKALGFEEPKAAVVTLEAHTSGRAIVWTGPKEVAEFKVEQLQTFHETRAQDGAKLGPLDCNIEPAPGA
jgi:ATP-dependent Clp protease adaptor protein ClpS